MTNSSQNIIKVAWNMCPTVKQEPGEGEEPMEVDTVPALSRLTVGPSTNTGDLFLELNADPEG